MLSAAQKPQDSRHPVARSGKPPRRHCRGGHVDATRAARTDCSSGPKDTRTTPDVPDNSGSEREETPSRLSPTTHLSGVPHDVHALHAGPRDTVALASDLQPPTHQPDRLRHDP